MINYTVVGIVCSVVGNVLISLALNIQKYAHNRIQQQAAALAVEEEPLLGQLESQASSEDIQSSKITTNYLSSPYWWLGASIMLVGESGNFVAYGFAPVSVVSPLGIVTIISNCTMAPLIFNEPVRARDIIGTIFASIGVLLVIASSFDPQSSQPKIPDPSRFIYDTLTSYLYFYYVLGSIAVILAMVSMLKLMKRKLPYYLASNNLQGKSLYTVGNIFLVAIFGAHTAIATKCLSSLIEFSHNIWDLLLEYQTYYLISVLVITAVFQIKYLNNSLRVESSTKVIPIHFVCFTISVLIGSSIVFKDYKNRVAWQLVLFMMGCCLTFVSVFLIAGSEKPLASEPLEDQNPQIHIMLPENTTGYYTALEPKNSHGALNKMKSNSSLVSTNNALSFNNGLRESIAFLSRSTSVGELRNEFLTVPNDSSYDTHSLPDSGANRPGGRLRSKSFVDKFNQSKSELVGIPGTGSVILNQMLTSINNK